jgi:hypothetical protein
VPLFVRRLATVRRHRSADPVPKLGEGSTSAFPITNRKTMRQRHGVHRAAAGVADSLDRQTLVF